MSLKQDSVPPPVPLSFAQIHRKQSTRKGRNSRSSGRETVVHLASSDQVSSFPSCRLVMASLCVLLESFPPWMVLNPWLFLSTGASFACIKFCSIYFFDLIRVGCGLAGAADLPASGSSRRLPSPPWLMCSREVEVTSSSLLGH